MIESIDRQKSDPLSSFWKDSQVLRIANNISPRLSHFVQTLTPLYSDFLTSQFTPKQLQVIEESFKSIAYTKQVSRSAICCANDDKLKYYRCFNCSISGSSCICQLCFNDPKHAHHEFKIINSTFNYCDCGNQQYIRKESFCKQHGQNQSNDQTSNQKETQTSISKKQIDLFNKEMEFLLFLSLKSRQLGEEIFLKKTEHLGIHVMQIFIQHGTNSYNYQRMTGQLLLQQFKKQCKFIQQETILHLIFWQEWKSDLFYKKFSKLLCLLYPFEPIRKKILIQYFNLHTSQIRNVIWVSPLTAIDSHYFSQGKLILKLLKNNIIAPLSLNFKFTTIDSTAGCFIQIYKGYRLMFQTSVFTEILQQSLKRINFNNFYSFHIIDRESRTALNIVIRHYLIFLNMVMTSLHKFNDKGSAEIKIIHQSYKYIKAKQQVYNICPERTLCWCIFSYYQCNLQHLHQMTILQIMQLLGQQSIDGLQQGLQKMVQCLFNIFRIQNYNDYRELSSDTKYDLNVRNRVVLALDYTCIRIILTFLQIVYKEKRVSEIIPLRNWNIGKLAVLEKWVYLHKVEQIKKQAIIDPEGKAQIVTLMETGLFIKIQDQIAGNTIELIAVINNLLFACESPLCELILSNLLGKPQQQKIINIYREFAQLHPNKPRIEFKALIQSFIYNQQLIKQFILGEHQSYFKGERKSHEYNSNLSYCCRFFNDQITDDTTQRFIKKLQSSLSGTSLTRFIFTESFINQIIKYTRNFIKFITGSSVQIKENNPLNVTFNLLLESIIIIYMETRSYKLKALLYQINATSVLADNYTDYSKIIIKILMDYFSKEEQDTEKMQTHLNHTINRKQTAKMKRDLKMKEMKEKQQKFLQNCSVVEEEKVQEGQDQCIICKTSSSKQHHLYYLCKIRFSNTFTKNILGNNEIMMVITTCGHKIHERCLSQNIDTQDKYGRNYHCFLCKQLSNLRIPFDISSSNIDTFLQYFLTIISQQVASNPSLQARQRQQYTTLSNLTKMFYDSIVLSIYFYYFSIDKFYLSYILPIVQAQILILKWLSKSFYIPSNPYMSQKDKKLRLIEQKVHSIVTSKSTPLKQQAKHFLQTNNHQCNKQKDSQYIDRLFMKIFDRSLPTFHEIKNIERFNFFSLPKDLRNLTKQIGKCRGCRKYKNKTFLCFLCGFKVCADCNNEMNIHLDSHLGATILIDVENGRYSYRYRNVQISDISLYVNYIGQQYVNEAEFPTWGEFQLSQDRFQKLIDQVLKDSTQSTVEDFVRQAESFPICNVQ